MQNDAQPDAQQSLTDVVGDDGLPDEERLLHDQLLAAGSRWARKLQPTVGHVEAYARSLGEPDEPAEAYLVDVSDSDRQLNAIRHDKKSPEERLAASEMVEAHVSAFAVRPQPRLPSRSAAFGTIAAVLVVGVVVMGFAALLGHRQSRPGMTTRPQPQVGDWRLLSMPSKVPDQASEGQFILTPQTSIAGLLYACWSEPAPDGSALLWRSDDAGLHWKRLTTPSTTVTPCYLDVSPGAPNTVFFDTTSTSPGYYSLDRGDHWSRHTPPAEYEQWNAGAPTAEGDVWYYLSRDADDQPVFLVTRDHGAHWETHGFPFHLKVSPRPGASPLFPPYLRVRYEKGGYVVPYEDTLWWTPDYGVTWRKLAAWGDGSWGYTPPCNDRILGTPNLELLYCVEWIGEFDRAYWRSVDRGLTWQAVPYGPPVSQTQDTPHGTLPTLLRDGTLLEVSPMPGDSSKVAFYSLAPGTTVWRQASQPLNDVARCSSQQGTVPAPICVYSRGIVITDGVDGGQYIYLLQDDGTAVMGKITWK